MAKTLVTGGVRSGKSRVAEDLLRTETQVLYVAPGPIPDPVADPDWAARIDAHRQRRPAHWQTVETTDVAAAVGSAAGALIVDCLGTWVTALVDDLDGWDLPTVQLMPVVQERIDDLVAAWRAAPGPAVAVTNEVGMGVVPEHRSGRTFRDLLGVVNQSVAAVSDDVILVVAGRTILL